MDTEKIFKLIQKKDEKIEEFFNKMSELLPPEVLDILRKLSSLYAPLLIKAVELEGLDKKRSISLAYIILNIVSSEIALAEEVMEELQEDAGNNLASLEEALEWMQNSDLTDDGKEPEPFEPN